MKLDAIQFNTSTTDTPSWTKLVDLIYPKNSIYLTRGTNAPGDAVGGDWTAITTGSVLALTGSNGFAAVGENGGSLKISVKQIPSHSHILAGAPNTGNDTSGVCMNVPIANANYGFSIFNSACQSGNTESQGGGRIICLIIIPSKDTTETPSKCGDVEWL